MVYSAGYSTGFEMLDRTSSDSLPRLLDPGPPPRRPPPATCHHTPSLAQHTRFAAAKADARQRLRFILLSMTRLAEGMPMSITTAFTVLARNGELGQAVHPIPPFRCTFKLELLRLLAPMCPPLKDKIVFTGMGVAQRTELFAFC